MHDSVPPYALSAIPDALTSIPSATLDVDSSPSGPAFHSPTDTASPSPQARDFATDSATCPIGHAADPTPTDYVSRLEAQVERLQRAVIDNRKIGLALGVLATSRQISYLQAHDLPRAASHGSGRTIREVADEVAFSGVLVWPPARPRQRHPVRRQRHRDGGYSA